MTGKTGSGKLTKTLFIQTLSDSPVVDCVLLFKGTRLWNAPFRGVVPKSPFSTHPPIEERVARLVGSRPHGRDFSGNSLQKDNNAHSDGATMDDQSRSFWNNMS